MKINKDLVDKIATLSGLEFEESEKGEIAGDLQKIINLVEKLNELDTAGVEPMVYMTDEVNNLRADEKIEIVRHEEALKNAPLADSDYFKVPKVMPKN